MKRKPVKKKEIIPSRWLSFIKATCDTCKFAKGTECPFKNGQTIEEIKARKCIYHVRRTK